MSILTYNSVVLPYCQATDFRQEAVFDESQTDRIYTKFDITVQSFVNAEYLQLLAPEINGRTSSVAEIMRVVRSKLLQHRRTLSYKFNGVELIPDKQALVRNSQQTVPGQVDAKNGPQPKFCSILQATNTTFIISFHVIAHYWENLKIQDSASQLQLTKNDTGGNCISNRWSETVELDDCMQSTRTREGTFIIRSDNAGAVLADQLRSQMAVVGIPAGFLRESARYGVSKDGLSINYNIVDKEVFKMPPRLGPSSSARTAYRASGKYRETGVKYAAVRYGEVQLRLRGANDVPQGDLLNAALALVVVKIRNRTRDPESGLAKETIPDNIIVEHDLFENMVDVVYRVRFTNNERTRIFALAAFNNMNTTTPFSSRNGQPQYRDRGTIPILVQAAAYYDPSNIGVSLNAGRPTISNDNQTTQPGFRGHQLDQGIEVGREGIQG